MTSRHTQLPKKHFHKVVESCVLIHDHVLEDRISTELVYLSRTDLHFLCVIILKITADERTVKHVLLK